MVTQFLLLDHNDVCIRDDYDIDCPISFGFLGKAAEEISGPFPARWTGRLFTEIFYIGS